MLRYIIAAPLLLLAVPAAAQLWDGPAPDTPAGKPEAHPRVWVQARTGGETGKIRSDVRDGYASGQLSRRSARQLRREAGQIDAMESRFGSDGLSFSEEKELQVRRELLHDDVVAKRRRRR